MREIEVNYMALPDIKDGVASFYNSYRDTKCAEPAKDYASGRCHVTWDELDSLALQAGFITREQFREVHGEHSLNEYGYQLSMAVGKVLLREGICLEINGEKVRFRCKEDRFCLWPKSRREFLVLDYHIQSF
ncbi:hypothetical protein ACQCVH_06640 [Bacillus infantis]|uniref:hypothetical protein n=1 Tax=Bacillus infantis TaxID=324767 RepID=UPI003CE99504